MMIACAGACQRVSANEGQSEGNVHCTYTEPPAANHLDITARDGARHFAAAGDCCRLFAKSPLYEQFALQFVDSLLELQPVA